MLKIKNEDMLENVGLDAVLVKKKKKYRRI
jgi:hypothetical protein